ncbi:MAG TPA: metallophosphoesterase [Oligoflexus sp.]|uniref:metallophosphoesterase n=1 Tax=Oligoflexus sp. TaxID=1971216 RepID=UPI002D7FCB3A|nr:metallophosphoesterase [Oligoflexus sp.]HET9237666.1 metallophosphoesterase [Oligoflexus sp.]
MQNALTHIAIYGDAGRGNSEQFALGRIMARRHALNPFRFALSTGDNQYDPTTPELMQRIFEEPFAELIQAGVPFFQTPGNHDMDEDRISEQLQYSQRVNALARGQGGWVLPAANYVIRDRFVKIIVLNVTAAGSEFPQPAEALQFLEAELAEETSDWKVVCFHYHLWSTGLRGDHEEMKAVFLPLLERYPVDFIFAGHEHHAEIFAPWKGMQFAIVGHGSEIREHVMPSDQECLFRTNDIGFVELSLDASEAKLVFVDRHGQEIWKNKTSKAQAIPLASIAPAAPAARAAAAGTTTVARVS